MIIDFHTHIFPDKIAQRTINILEGNIRDNGGTEKAFLDGTLSSLKSSMRDSGVNYSVVLPIATTITQSTTINNFAAEINGKDNIFSFGSVHPMQENAESELERIADMGLRGIKLHPDYQGVYADSPECIRVLKKAERLGLLVVFHSGFDIGMRPPAHCTPKMLRSVIDSLDNGGSNIIAAHMGGWRQWDDTAEYLAGTQILLDTSFSIPYMKRGVLEKILTRHGSDKILFGSDSPWQRQSDSAESVKSLGLSDEDSNNILFRNAKRLLGIHTAL